MKLIRNTPNPSGAYPPMQETDTNTIPAGMAEWPDELDTAVFYEYNGFVTLEIQDNEVQSCTPNVEAWEAWKATLPPDPGPEPEPEYVTYEELAAAIREGVNQV